MNDPLGLRPQAATHAGNSSIPAEDFHDVQAAVDDLTARVSAAAAGLDMQRACEPFTEALLRLRREAMPAREGATGSHPVIWTSTPEDVDAALRRIEATPAQHSPWVSLDAGAALARAQALHAQQPGIQPLGLLHGVPVGIKDMFERRGKIAGWGAAFRAESLPATTDAATVTRLEDAGAVILGSLHMAECAMSPTGLNDHLGHGSNPHDREHVSGGSSSGAGMAVGAGDVPLAIGSDTGGSVRLPAALCGVTGLKPTQFRWSSAGAMPLSPTMDCIGPLAISADLCGLALAAVAGPDSQDLACVDLPAIRPGTWRNRPAHAFTVAVPRFVQGPLLSPEMLETLTHTRNTLADAGVRIIEVDTPDLTLLGQLASVILAVESASVHRNNLADRPEVYGRQVRRRLSRGLLMGGMAFHDAQRLRVPLLRRFMAAYLDNADALLLPTTPGAAPRIADTIGPNQAQLEQEFGKLSYWTRGINYLGLPGLSVPAGRTAAGLPLGVQFIGAPFDEERLLAIGHLFQTLSDWHARAA